MLKERSAKTLRNTVTINFNMVKCQNFIYRGGAAGEGGGEKKFVQPISGKV